jgi:hypothetical protein
MSSRIGMSVPNMIRFCPKHRQGHTERRHITTSGSPSARLTQPASCHCENTTKALNVGGRKKVGMHIDFIMTTSIRLEVSSLPAEEISPRTGSVSFSRVTHTLRRSSAAYKVFQGTTPRTEQAFSLSENGPLLSRWRRSWPSLCFGLDR